MSYFPMDVTADILLQLPVKPLLRFRCVSQLWCALINSRDFIKLHINRSIKAKKIIKLHINRSIKAKNNLSFLLKDGVAIDGHKIYSIDFDSLDDAIELDRPFKCSNFGTNVVDSCDGLVCLYNGEEDVAIWNPLTRKYQKLPYTEIENRDPFSVSQYVIYGMAYDSVSDDYKVVKIVQFYEEYFELEESEVKVYSLNSNSWRRIRDFPCYFRYQNNGVFAGGALHWVVSRMLESNISSWFDDLTLEDYQKPRYDTAAFDLAAEYRLVPQPDFSDGKDVDVNVGVLEGCLWMLCNYHRVRVDVWVMKDYGVKESWSKLVSIRLFEFVTLKPLAYSKSGSEVLLVQDHGKAYLVRSRAENS